MDQVVTKFVKTVIDPEKEKPTIGYEGLYKNWRKTGQQEQRRKNILEIQKSNRNSRLDACRNILEFVDSLEEHNEQQRKGLINPGYRPRIYVAGFTKTPSTYRNVLMMSEWLVEKPEDFEDNWYVVPCPKGVRTLVVACKGNTKCYTKYGFFRLSCPTALPGGNTFDPNYKSNCVVLDCFHLQATNTLYVLDLLAWNSQPMTDGETEFRHYWMKTHIEDIPELKTINEKNKILFEVLPKYDCKRESLNKVMMTYPMFKNYTPDLDGLLFYHKLVHYVAGVTPLVGWLYPFMVQEVLGADITVNTAYHLSKPMGYINQADYIYQFEHRHCKSWGPQKPKEQTATTSVTSSDETNQQKPVRRRRHKQRSNDATMSEENGMEADDSVSAFMQSMQQQPMNVCTPRMTRIHPSTSFGNPPYSNSTYSFGESMSMKYYKNFDYTKD